MKETSVISRDGKFLENLSSQGFILPASKIQHTMENCY